MNPSRAKSSRPSPAPSPQPEINATRMAPGAFTQAEASAYLAGIISELRHIARRSDFRTLTYLLEMACQESIRLTVSSDRENADADVST